MISHCVFKLNLFIFGCAESSLLHGLFSSCGKRELLSSCGVQASLCVASFAVQHGLEGTESAVAAAPGLSSFGSWALEHRLNSCGAWA